MRAVKKWVWLLPLWLVLVGCDAERADEIRLADTSSVAVCSEAWNTWVEQEVGSGDGEGHGPDIGSSEWQQTISFRLDLPAAQLPQLGSIDWCELIDRTIKARAKSP